MGTTRTHTRPLQRGFGGATQFGLASDSLSELEELYTCLPGCPNPQAEGIREASDTLLFRLEPADLRL